MGKEIFRDMVEGSSVGFFALDRKGVFVYLNRALAELFGYEVEGLLGRSALELLVHPDDREAIVQEAKKLIRGDTAFSLVSFRGRKRDGTELHGEVLLWTVQSGDERLFVGNLLDVTEKVTAQRKLTMIRELGRKAILLRDIRQVAQAVVNAVHEVLGVSSCGIWTVKGEELVRIAHVYDHGEVRLPLYGERGIIAHAVREKRPIYVPDTEKEPRYLRGKIASRSEFCVPLVVRGEPLGALNAEKEEVDGFSETDRELIESLAAIAAIALENAIQFERERKMLEQLKLINEVALRTAALKAPEDLYREVVELIAERFGYHSVALFTVEGEEVVLRAIAGELAELVHPGYRQPRELGILGHVLRTKMTYLAPDVTRDPYYVQGYEAEIRTLSELCVPIETGGRVMALLDIQSRDLAAFDEVDVNAAETISRWISVILENAKLYEQLRKTLESTAVTLAEVVEIRDPYTAGHQRRVAALAVALAQQLNLPPERVEAVRLVALLHDIGKIAAPAEVLNKPGKLSELEMRFVRKHPWTAFKVLRDIPFPYPVAEIVLQHHERMDGSGYPRGLKGDEIMLEARILAVADVVEAMSSHRPYRPPYPIEEVLAELEQQRGKLYDAQVVEACVKLFREKGFRFPQPPLSQRE